MEKREGSDEEISQHEDKSKDPNAADGKKIIEIQKKLQDTSEEEADKDAENWRNEG